MDTVEVQASRNGQDNVIKLFSRGSMVQIRQWNRRIIGTQPMTLWQWVSAAGWIAAATASREDDTDSGQVCL